MRLSIQITISDVDPLNEHDRKELAALLKRISSSFDNASNPRLDQSTSIPGKLEIKGVRNDDDAE